MSANAAIDPDEIDYPEWDEDLGSWIAGSVQITKTASGGLTINIAAPAGPRAVPLPKAPPFATSKEPIHLAQEFLKHTPPILRWAGLWWQLLPGHSIYKHIDDEIFEAKIGFFLHTCCVDVTQRDGSTIRERVKSEKKRIAEVVKALTIIVRRVFDAPPCWVPDTQVQFDPRDVVACPNGLLHLPTQTLMPANPDLFITAGISTDYDPTAPTPAEWLKFLDQVWPTDQDSIDTLQTIIGHFLSLDTRYHKIFVLIGPPRSGKSTIARVAIDGLLGVGNVAHPTLGSFERNFGLEELIGKSVAVVGDARMGGRADQAAIVERLLSISGEDALTIDRKYRQAVTVRLSTRLFIISNEPPRVSDVSAAIASRFLVLETKNSFLGQEDHTLEPRLLNELPGILNWAIQGWARLRQSDKFHQPASGQETLDEMRDLSSPMNEFVRECMTVNPLAHVEIPKAYAAWEAWCKANGIQGIGTKNRFARDIRVVVPHVKRTSGKRNGLTVYSYHGIGLASGHSHLQSVPTTRALKPTRDPVTNVVYPEHVRDMDLDDDL